MKFSRSNAIFDYKTTVFKVKSHPADPHDGLVELQKAIDAKVVKMDSCVLHSDIVIHFDRPNGENRFSYAKIVNGEIRSFAFFVIVEPLNNLPCFNVGYAVPEKYRNQGLGTDILKRSIDELAYGFGRNNVKEFYLEAIVGKNNTPSQKLLSKVFVAHLKSAQTLFLVKHHYHLQS